MEDDDFLPLSALQHWVFCPRQCLLIHGEQQWAENRLTAEGRLLHDKADEPGEEWRGAVRVARAVRLVHRGVRLIGIADVVEFHRCEQNGEQYWQPLPVEYKRGQPKEHNADRIQLCAQALCLEEIFSLSVPDGALFYGQPRRREQVVFDQDLRQKTTDVIFAARTALAQTGLPPSLEHCAQKWVPVLRKNNATTQDLRAFLRFRVKAKRSSGRPALPVLLVGGYMLS